MQLPSPILRVLQRQRVAGRLNFMSRMSIGTRHFAIPILGGAGLQNLRGEEPWLLPVLQVLLRLKRGAFLDVGMNVGQTLLKFLSVEHDGHDYYGFEPNPMAAAYTYKLIRSNNAANVSVIPVGLSDRTGIASFFLSGEYDTKASAIEGFREQSDYSTKRFIAIMRGDDVIDGLKIDAISVLKIDVEGGEMEVLLGLENTIRRARPFISCEVLPIRDTHTDVGQLRRQRADRVQTFLASIDYGICRVLNTGVLEELNDIPTHDDLSLCEYLFMPKEDMAATIAALSVTGK